MQEINLSHHTTSPTLMENIEFVLTLVHHDPRMLDQEIEFAPYLYAYLSKNVNPSAMVRSAKLLINKPVRMSLECDTTSISPHQLAEQVIGFSLHCHKRIRSDYDQHKHLGYHRYEPLAESFLFFSQLSSSSAAAAVTMFIDFNDPSDESNNAYRARVQFQLLRTPRALTNLARLDYSAPAYQSGGGGRVQGYDSCSLSLLCKKGGRGVSFENRINEYIDVLRTKIKPSEESCVSVHVPYWKTGFGNLLAPMYAALMPRHAIDESYVLYSLDIVLSTNASSRQELEQALRSQLSTPQHCLPRTNFCMKIISELCSMWANTCDYLPDLSKGTDAERFIDIQETFSGDCEDMAKSIQVCAQVLKRSLQILTNPLLKAMSALLQYYQIVLTTGCVTTASASSIRDEEVANNTQHPSAAQQQKNNKRYMCHIFTMMLPTQWIVDSMLSHMPRESPMVMTLLDGGRRQFQPFEAALPVVVCEGTNFVNPLMEPLSTYVSTPSYVTTTTSSSLQEATLLQDAQKKKEGARLLFEVQYKHLKRLVVQAQQMNITGFNPRSSPESYCTFYRKVNEIWIDFGNLVNSSSSTLGPVAFAMVYSGGGNSTTAQPQYGTWIRDIVRKNPSIKLYPMYVMNPQELELSYNVMDRMPPMRVLSFKDDASPSVLRLQIMQQHRPLFDRLTRIVERASALCRTEMNRDRVASIQVLDRHHYLLTSFYTYYANHARKLDDKILETFEALVETRVMRDFQYFLHPLSDDGDLYLVEFRLYPKSSAISSAAAVITTTQS